ncbi:DUF2188 domain-containing protein [Aquamicrobium sp. LC103]|uniref:DUF2188 domain-containing protein n=1 Tax=Aquamicrobium sp. LC103 TaxID=1120658 RepID=UPI00063EBB01|nr:DUF2188 domain-containing protein [Aquamicrobium sp. LC103]TKT75240.1 DUF2188 domain-containing protein [Aquamicrobium sp. LC103]
MARVVYEIVEHDGGWAYKVDGVFSETFASHDDALRAARIAAAEQKAPGESGPIEYEDESGKWHIESSSGSDRPETEVDD